MQQSYHIPVLATETICGLNLKDDSIVVDGTLGGGGHTNLILDFSKNTKVIAFDRDLEAINFASQRLVKYKNRIEFIHSNYKNIPQVLNQKNLKVDAILLDLGVSSHQIDSAERGFSFKVDGKLDMRMNTEDGLTAYDVVNNYKQETLADVIYNYGEERLSRKISKAIVDNRPINTTFELKKIVEDCVKHYNFKEISSSVQRVFQAIRIEVNDELNGLYELIINLPNYIKSGGRIAIITFHSLEDRIVKRAFNELSTNCICPPEIPICVCNHKAQIKLINKKPIIAGEQELSINSRAKSAKLRIAQVI